MAGQSHAPQTPQQGGMTQFIVMLLCLLMINWYIMKTFFPPESAPPKTAEEMLTVKLGEEKEPLEEETHSPRGPDQSVPGAEKSPQLEKTTPSLVGEDRKEETSSAAVDDSAESKKTSGSVHSKLEQEKLISLGSADPDSPYRMLVTLSTRGASVANLEMNEPSLSALGETGDYKGGWIGFLTTRLNENGMDGCPVDVVSLGTPAQRSGLKVGDVITAVDNEPVKDKQAFLEIIRKKKPASEAHLTIRRKSESITISVVLGREPVSIIKPENGDPLSFLMTLGQLGSNKLPTPSEEAIKSISKTDIIPLQKYLNLELPNVSLRNNIWEVESERPDHVVMYTRVPAYGLEVRKTYSLEPIPEMLRENRNYKAYHLVMKVAIKNTGTHDRTLSIQQDGPTGLPTEGHWFCSKVSRSMFGMVGIRDIIIGFQGNNKPTTESCPSIANDDWGVYKKVYNSTPGRDSYLDLKYIGVDAQYFSAVMFPKKGMPYSELEEYATLRVGTVPNPWNITTDTSCRIRTAVQTLKPGEESLQEYTIFAGPKRPVLMQSYGLDNVVYYGWFSFVAVPLTWLLHQFYGLVGNYGLAIIMLTVVVRLVMYPLSRKQVMGALVMQKLQPEIKKLQEKYPDPMERQRAQMELFRKHHYNPMSGCWVMFIQLPIFIALYRSLLVDIELRQEPLISEGIRFCSNLAAPDMLFYWKDHVWSWLGNGYGMFGLGPYFNLLPMLTIGLFLAQQKMLMPPPVDDQARMQQKIMTWMMVFMGLLFFKVPSGLCIYFIASSLWGVMERQMMPKQGNVLDNVPGVIDVPSRQVRKESFTDKLARLGGWKKDGKVNPEERARRRKGKK